MTCIPPELQHFINSSILEYITQYSIHAFSEAQSSIFQLLFGCGIFLMLVPEQQDFGQRSTCSKKIIGVL